MEDNRSEVATLVEANESRNSTAIAETQEQCATLKQYVKHGRDAFLINRIANAFPEEYGEAIDEAEKGYD